MATTYFTVLPQDTLQPLASNEVLFLRLTHPRTGLPALFLPVETDESANEAKSQVLEVQAVNPVESRSWFLKDEVVGDGRLLVMTPIDPAFILLPILRGIQPANNTARQFKPIDDILEEAAEMLENQTSLQKDVQPVTSSDILKFFALRCTRNALPNICDIKEITEDITVYRFSEEKTLEYMRKKVDRLSKPSTLEISRTIVRNLAKDGLMDDGKEELLRSGQLRAACDLISHYLPCDIRDRLYASYDFAALDDHLKESIALALTTNIPTAEKEKPAVKGGKRKAAKGSHGVESLKKANVSGMAKLSSFFKKAEKS